MTLPASRPARALALSVLLPALLAAALSGCASLRLGDERRAYDLKEYGTFTYAKGCLDVWPDVLKLVGSKGYPLVGRDRQYAGEGPQSGFARFAEQGYETRAVEGGGLVVLTGWLGAAEGNSRYEVRANPGPSGGCAITFTYIYTGTIDPSNDRRETDWKIQSELVKKLQPADAARIEAGAPKA